MTPLPQAVILPGSTEEVQNIVKLCNKYKIEFKASTTFWAAMGYIGSDYAIRLDMRRMKYLEIAEKNQMAIIEPHALVFILYQSSPYFIKRLKYLNYKETKRDARKQSD